MFGLLLGSIIIQRFAELFIAKKNEVKMKAQGGIEVGEKHYRYIVLIHVLFFVTFIAEVIIGEKQLSSFWPFLLPLFLLVQIGRGWMIHSLGPYWNTKIIIVPKGKVIRKGPYQFMRHPNYLIVALEFIVIPCLFQAYVTAVVFSLLNVLILIIRIPAEEKALVTYTNYETELLGQKRFIPTKTKRI